MGLHGLSSGEKGQRSPIREKDKATDDGIKSAKKKAAKKKVDANVANDQKRDQETSGGDKSPTDG